MNNDLLKRYIDDQPIGSDVRLLYLFCIFNFVAFLQPTREQFQGLFIGSHRLRS